MTKLINFMALGRQKFWDRVNHPQDYQPLLKSLWVEAMLRILTQEEAILLLNALFLDSHYRIREHSVVLAKHYPTKQFTRNRLEKRENLWWTDHFTAGISRWSTLNWFSAAKRKKKSGKMGYAGASTHFVQGYHGLPFYIIPLMHGAWHEPRRNKDSISIEFVNCGKVHLKPKNDGTGEAWHYWARALPPALVRELPPVRLDTPYRGVRAMQPFTHTQLLNAITLKRIVIAAFNGESGDRLDHARFSQHSDWRDGKTDMGPLWMFDEINDAAFGTIPVEDYAFVQDDTEYIEHLDAVGTPWDEVNGWEDENELLNNPESGEETPTHDDDPDDDSNPILSILEVQQYLARQAYTLKIDGKMGPMTRSHLKTFQKRWNNQHPDDALKVDGIPGPRTCSALKRS